MKPTDIASNKRQQLLDAARLVIAERGFENTPISAIVERAGVSQGTFYTYFDAKTELPGAFASTIRSRIMQTNLRHIQAKLAPAQFFPLVIKGAFDVVESYHDILECIDLNTLLGEFDRELDDPANTLKSGLVGQFKQWQDVQAISPKLHPEIAVHLVSGVLQRMFKDLVVKQVKLDREAYITEVVAFICRALGADTTELTPPA